MDGENEEARLAILIYERRAYHANRYTRGQSQLSPA